MFAYIIKLLFQFEVAMKIGYKFVVTTVKKSFSKVRGSITTYLPKIFKYIKTIISHTKSKIGAEYVRRKLLVEIQVGKLKQYLKNKRSNFSERLREKKKERVTRKKKETVLSNSQKYIDLIGNHPNVYNTLTDIVDLTIKQLDYEVSKLVKNGIYIIRPDSEEFVELTVRFVDRFKINTGEVVYRSFCDWFGGEDKLLELITFLFYRKIATTLSSALETTLSELNSGV